MKLLRWLPQLSLRWRESPIDRRLKRESEEWAFRLARKSDDRTMGPTLEHTVIQLFDSLEQRVTALEEFERATTMVERHERRLNRVAEELTEHLKAATPSPPTASPTTDSPSDVPERDYTPRLSPASWRSGLATTTGGPAAPVSDSAQETDVPT